MRISKNLDSILAVIYLVKIGVEESRVAPSEISRLTGISSRPNHYLAGVSRPAEIEAPQDGRFYRPQSD